MHCLVCHAKISRWRRLKTSSQFCCDEHFEQHKREAVGRLLESSQPASDLGSEDPIHRLTAITQAEYPNGETPREWKVQSFMEVAIRRPSWPRIPMSSGSDGPAL